MAEAVDDLVAEIRAVVDVDAAAALRLLNRRHKQFCAASRCYQGTVTYSGTDFAGVTIWAQSSAPEVVELKTFLVDGQPYGRATLEDYASYEQGWLVWEGPGLFLVDETGVIRTIPNAATTATVYATAALLPPDLVAGGAAGTLLCDTDFNRALVEGAVSDELLLIGEGDPASLEAKFQAAVVQQTQRVRRRMRGGGPSQIRVQGYNA